jgi:NAD(P)-dependent dehydrogenase (short-subunit alcohol dehydrogenase family)
MTVLDTPLAGRVAIITGAGRGVGRAHALAYAKAGAKVVVNDYGGSGDGVGNSAQPAESVVAEIADAGGEAVANFADVADPEAAAGLVAQAVSTFGRLDTLVNNAGILRDKSLLNMSLEDWQLVLRVHLQGTFVMTQAAGRYWRDQTKEGEKVAARIINTSSGSGLFGNFGQANYASAKGGIASLTVLSAIELGRYGVTANAIAPVARTRLTATAGMALEPESAGFDPLDPSHISPLLLWLGSEFSGEVTGRIFSVVGGYVGVVEGYNRGPEILHDGPLTFADIDRELPDVLAKSRPRTPVRESHPYIGGARP